MKRLLFTMLSLTLLAAASTAWAHGPSRLKVVKTIDIAAPPAKVWAIVSDFGKIDTWLPAIDKVVATGGNTPGTATRVITLKDGGVIEEALTKYNASAMMYGYEITKVDPKVLPVNDYSSMMTVSANASGGTTVEWKGAFYRGYMNNDPPKELNDESSQKAVEGVYDLGLSTIKKLAEK
jgi:hypothetical protein